MTMNKLIIMLLATGLAALAAAAPGATPEAGSEGMLHAIAEDGAALGPCPLKHSDVKVDISRFVARVTVTQEFGNPFPEPIEAIYTFPLSEKGAVDAMTMLVGDRTIKGVIKRREEARQIYEDARRAGKVASLLDQERPNIFTQSVANILPGNEIRITISYVEYLEYKDGQYTFSFPMVVGPRYIPGGGSAPRPMERGTGTPQVPDAERITPPVTPEGTRAGHDISLEVRLDTGGEVGEITSELHPIEITPAEEGASTRIVRLKKAREIPNRDFVLHYAVSGAQIEDAVLTHTGAKGGFFTLVIQPPKRVAADVVTPKEMVFVIDCSGSMSGFPIETAKSAMRQCIEGMNPGDTFNLVSFAGGTGYCFERPVPNTPDNRRAALAYLSGLQGGGGTEMMKAINACLGGPKDPERLRVVCFMTDGFIGNDMEILGTVKKNRGTARVFAFGIGNSVNRFLIENMGREGRGEAEVITLESDGNEAAKRFHERIQHPVLTDITVDFGDLPVADVYPAPETMPDLFASQPIIIKGRYTGSAEGTVLVRGQTANGPFERVVPVTLPAEATGHDVLAPLWARTRIDALLSEDWLGAQQGAPNPGLKEAITELGLDYRLMTQYTSFVAVEEKVVNEGGQVKTIDVPVEMPDGVSYDGVFGETQERLSALGYIESKGVPAGANLGLARKMNAADASMPQSLPSPPPSLTVVAPDGPPAPEEAAKEPVRLAETVKTKLDKALWEVAANPPSGTALVGGVQVTGGQVDVVIFLSDDSDENMDALKRAGVVVTAHARSGMKVLARLRATDLAAIAALDFVSRIEARK